MNRKLLNNLRQFWQSISLSEIMTGLSAYNKINLSSPAQQCFHCCYSVWYMYCTCNTILLNFKTGIFSTSLRQIENKIGERFSPCHTPEKIEEIRRHAWWDTQDIISRYMLWITVKISPLIPILRTIYSKDRFFRVKGGSEIKKFLKLSSQLFSLTQIVCSKTGLVFLKKIISFL